MLTQKSVGYTWTFRRT